MSAPVNTTPPTIVGEPVRDTAVTIDLGDWSTSNPAVDTYTALWSNHPEWGWIDAATPVLLWEGDVGTSIYVDVAGANVDGAATVRSVPFGPIQETAAPPGPNLTPTIADVAALIRARTKDSNGNELGTFTSDTRPTDAQAQEAIDHAVVLVHLKVGVIGSRCASVARMCATYGAAAEIELSYFPEQARTERSPYQYLIARWEEILDGVEQCVLGNLPDDPSDNGGGDVSGLRFGTIDAISGVVHSYYTGDRWPRLPNPPEPAPSSERDRSEPRVSDER